MRIAFLIDGFNLYHSIKDVIADGHGTSRLKWLDIPDLCSGIVRDCPAIPRVGKVESVHYFTAFAKHLESRSPGIVRRHQTFVSALKVRGAEVHLATFKKTATGRHEEKETDVAIAVTLLELFHEDEADCAFVMSEDTDLMPDPGTSIRKASPSPPCGDDRGRRAALSRFLVPGRLNVGSSW